MNQTDAERLEDRIKAMERRLSTVEAAHETIVRIAGQHPDVVAASGDADEAHAAHLKERRDARREAQEAE